MGMLSLQKDIRYNVYSARKHTLLLVGSKYIFIENEFTNIIKRCKRWSLSKAKIDFIKKMKMEI